MYEPNHELAIILQNTWICKSVNRSLQEHGRFSGPVIAHHFINSTSTNHVKETPIVRVFRLLKTTDQKALTAIISDARHTMFAKFPYNPTIVNFEQLYRQRITYMTAGCLFLIKKARLRFATKDEVKQDFDFHISPNIDVVILDIEDFSVFLRDQAILPHEVVAKTNMVYYDKEYYSLCSHNCLNPACFEESEKLISEDYDDVASI